VNNSEIV